MLKFKFNKNHAVSLQLFFVLSTIIIFCGLILFRYQTKQIKQSKGNELHSITEIKVIQLSNWLAERMNDADMISSSPLLMNFIRKWEINPNDKKLKQMIIKRISTWHRQGTYNTAILLDTKGNILMADHRDIPVPGKETIDLIKKVVVVKKPIFSDFYNCSFCKTIHLDVVLPVFDSDSVSKKVIAIMILRIDPDYFLYPYLQLWPVPSRTSETCLLRREGDEMVFMNDMRLRKGTALNTRINIKSKSPDAVRAMREGFGLVEGLDYRGVKVLSCVMKVPNTPWYLIAKTDIVEIYAPVRKLALVVIVGVSFLIILIGVLILLITTNQRRDYYEKLYKMELEREVLLKHFEYIIKYANDIIILHDENMKIVEVNDRALQSYGYAREEMMGMSMENIVSRDSQKQMHQRIADFDQSQGQIFETIHRNSKGKEFPVEVSLRHLMIEGRHYYQGIVRDITERKEAEQKNMQLAELLNNALNVIVVHDLNGNLIYANNKAHESHGYSKEEFMSLNLSQIVDPDSAAKIPNNMKKIVEEGEAVFEVRHKMKNGSTFPVEIFAKKSLWNGREVIFGIWNDITDRKQAEISLRENERNFHDLFNDNPLPTILSEVPSGIIKYVNKRMIESLGSSPKDIIGKTANDLGLLRDPVNMVKLTEMIVRSGKVDNIEIGKVLPNGQQGADLIYMRLMMLNGKQHCLTVVQDISDRIKMEKSLRESENKFRRIFENSSTGMVLTGLDGKLLQVNDSFASMLDYSKEELATKSLSDITHPDDIQISQQHFNDLYQGREQVSAFDKRYLSRNGKTVWVTISSILFKDISGKPLYAITHALDITERKRNEKLQTILFAISQATHSSADLPELYEHIHKVVSELIPANNFYIALVSEDESKLTFPYFVDEADPHPVTRPLGRGLTEYVLKTKAPLLVTPALYKEMSEQGEVSTVGSIFHNWLGVPLVTKGKAIGVLVVQSYNPDELYNDKDRDVLVFVSDHIAAAIQRKKIEYNLKESEAQKGLILQSMPVAVYTAKVSQETDATWISGNVVGLTGFTSEEFVSQPDFWRKRLHPDDHGWVLERFKNAEVSGRDSIEYRWQHRDGHYCWFQDMFIIRNAGGQREYLGILSDITNRKNTEQVLQTRQEAMDAVYHIATSLGETFQSICDRVAMDLAKILNIPHLMIQTMKENRIHIISFLSEGRMQNNIEAPLEGTPCEIVYQKGEPLEINTSLRTLFPKFQLSQKYELNAYLGVPFKGRSGKVLGLVCVYDSQAHIFSREEMHLLDIFAHYLGYEIERIELESTIRETEKIKLLSSIASGVAHEVRNPLHAIQAISEAMAGESGEHPEYKEYLDHIKVQVNRLSQLMKDLLELGKPIQPAMFKKESLADLVEMAAVYWQEAQVGSSKILMIDNRIGCEVKVFADGSKIQEVIINLLDNASQHSMEGQEIRLELGGDGDKMAVLRVVDRGSGIKHEYLARMFEPFFTTRKKGTGLGLTLCKRIVECHGGKIEVTNNQDGPGCTVLVALPLYAK